MLPLLQRYAMGAIPPVDVAVQAIFELVGTPEQEVVSVAALATANDKRNAMLVVPAITFFTFIVKIFN